MQNQMIINKTTILLIKLKINKLILIKNSNKKTNYNKKKNNKNNKIL